METLDPTQFLGIAGAGAIITALVEAFKRALNWDEVATNRIAPLFSIALGVLIFVAFTAVNPIEGTVGSAIFGAILTGIIAGATSAGIYSLGGKTVIRATLGTPGEG